MGLDRIEHSIAPIEDVMHGKFPVGSPELQAIFALMLAHNVYYDPTMRVYGASVLAKVPGLQWTWTDEMRFFTPYTQGLIRERARLAAQRPRPLYRQAPCATSLPSSSTRFPS